MITMALCNLVLNPLLIDGLGVLPGFGIAGSAYATILSMAIGVALGFKLLAATDIHFHPTLVRECDWSVSTRALARVAGPASFSNAINPMGLSILTAVLAISGYMFYSVMINYANYGLPAGLTEIHQWLTYLITLVCPLITMRLIAEEKSRGTLETMMTAPVGEWSFVLGKFAAAALFVAYLILPTAFYAVFISAYGTLDLTGAVAGYAGLLVTVSAVLSIGLFVSALSPCRENASGAAACMRKAIS